MMTASDTFLALVIFVFTGQFALSAQDPSGEFCDCLKDCETSRGRDFHNITLTGENRCTLIGKTRNYGIAGEMGVISGKGIRITRMDDNHPMGNEIALDR